jgi:hypothetical protein
LAFQVMETGIPPNGLSRLPTSIFFIADTVAGDDPERMPCVDHGGPESLPSAQKPDGIFDFRVNVFSSVSDARCTSNPFR